MGLRSTSGGDAARPPIPNWLTLSVSMSNVMTHVAMPVKDDVRSHMRNTPLRSMVRQRDRFAAPPPLLAEEPLPIAWSTSTAPFAAASKAMPLGISWMATMGTRWPRMRSVCLPVVMS